MGGGHIVFSGDGSQSVVSDSVAADAYDGGFPSRRVAPGRDDEVAERILARLQALASPVRLALLKALVVPTRAPDLRVPAARERSGFETVRFLSRSTIIEHLEVLEENGLVRRIGDLYAVDQQGMVALLQDVGDLAQLRALIEVDVEVTRESAPPRVQPAATFPRALLASGPEAGRAVALDGAGPWRVGRSAECEIALPHDPHVSRVHATIAREGDAFLVHVVAAAKNPVFLDFAAIAPGATARAGQGALLLAGATLVVLQA